MKIKTYDNVVLVCAMVAVLCAFLFDLFHDVARLAVGLAAVGSALVSVGFYFYRNYFREKSPSARASLAEFSYQEGWTVQTQHELMLQFLEQKALGEQFMEWLDERVRLEKEETEDLWSKRRCE